MVPMPGILECLDLRPGCIVAILLKYDVVVPTAVERRVEINQIDRFFVDIPPHDVEIIAVIETVHGFLEGGGPKYPNR
jgi:hypothetical protein